MRTLSIGLGAAAATFVALFAVVGALYLVQLLGMLGLFLGVEALMVGGAIWLGRNRLRMPGIADVAIVGLLIAAVLLLLWAFQPTYTYPMGERLKQH